MKAQQKKTITKRAGGDLSDSRNKEDVSGTYWQENTNYPNTLLKFKRDNSSHISSKHSDILQ